MNRSWVQALQQMRQQRQRVFNLDQFQKPETQNTGIKPLRISDQTVTTPSGLISGTKSDADIGRDA